MLTSKPTTRERERTILVTAAGTEKGAGELEDRVDEFRKLASSCGAVIASSEICRLRSITPNLFIGRGKAEEIAEKVRELNADTVIFNNDLSASQQKNLEQVLAVKTIDRTQLILDVFARRATSAEGKVQVELAQLVYLLPRLSRMWLHFSKQRGGIGTRGPGEQQLEVDRRKIRERISKLKKALAVMRRRRELRRSQREEFSMLTIALVGYTNSGKSTLFNAMTSAGVKTKDQLFSTLDPTVRKTRLSNNQTVLFSDTVGFLDELPHHLIESFKATLEEVVEADILFHVVDISDTRREEHASAVRSVLRDIGVEAKPIFTILNKSDLLDDDAETERIKRYFDAPFVISALKKRGLTEVDDLVVRYIQKDMEDIELVLPHKHYSISSIIRSKGMVKEEKYTDSGLKISARVPRKVKRQIFKALKGEQEE
jgi:GTPase